MSLKNIATENLDPWLISWNLDEKVMEVLREHANIIELPARETIFSEGEREAGAMYLVLEGMVLVLKKDENGVEKTVSIIVEGQSFGEVGLLIDQPRMATVAAGIDTRLLEITPELLEKLEMEFPRVAMSVYKSLARSFADQWVAMLISGTSKEATA